MLFNWIPHMVMLKLPMAITIVASLTIAIWVINMAILGFQLKSIKN